MITSEMDIGTGKKNNSSFTDTTRHTAARHIRKADASRLSHITCIAPRPLKLAAPFA